MADNQYKDFVEGIKEDLEELNEYKEVEGNERYDKKYKRLMDSLEKALNRTEQGNTERADPPPPQL